MGETPNYGEGTSNYGGETPNYGEGTSHVGGATLDWQAGYRPSFEDVGQGSSNIQLGTQSTINNNQQNNWVSSLFDYTTPSNMIPSMYSDQPRPFQNYGYTGLSVQQPSYQHLSPVQMTLESQHEGYNTPTELASTYEHDDPEPRRVQPPRHPKPVGCGTGGCLIRYPHRH